MKIILASKSKRRIEMMEELGFPFLSVDSNTEENVTFTTKEEYPVKIATKKAVAVSKMYDKDLVLGFDTLVFLDNEPIGKPHSKEECIEIIKKLRNKRHEVITGGCLIINGEIKETFYKNAYVYFSDITDTEIENYALTKEPYDKAGAYAIQGYMGRFIKKIEGDLFTIIGMPKQYVYELLKRYYK